MKRLFILLLALSLCLGLAACGGQQSPAPTAEPEEAAAPAAPTEAPAQAPAATAETVKVMVLNGTTGFGMAKLMADEAAGGAGHTFDLSVETDASNVTAALINGTCDIAALPTNAAATVYNKTEGGVQLLALNTLGVLYVVADAEAVSVQSLADLEGMTVYAPAQNPAFIFQAICQKAGVDVTVDDTYAQPADLRTALAAGEVDIAVLPEPMVTIACAKNDKLAVALDLTAEWDAVFPAGSLVQGCVVARTQFAQEHPDTVRDFLARYGASIEYLTQQPAEAAELIAETGVFADAAVAEKAIPHCNVCFITGEEMRSAMSQYLDILFGQAPQSVGGALPGDDFYWID